LIAWLNNYHQGQSHLPDLLKSSLVSHLKRFTEYQNWDLDALIRDDQTFSDFVQDQWQFAINQTLSGKPIHETGSGYHLAFDQDPYLQDLVPALVRLGTIRPLEIAEKEGLPAWIVPGISLMDARLNRFSLLLAEIENRLEIIKSDLKVQQDWNAWNIFAQDWAELCGLRYQSDLEISDLQKESFRKVVIGLDKVFSNWLRNNYSSLGAQRLPKPHHVYHVPHYLAYLRNIKQVERLVLIVLDGLSLTDWQVMQPIWTKRHLNWEFKIDILLAQVPTITSISRYALISGLLPADFANDLDHCAPESRAWELFWSREGISESSCKLLPLYFDRGIDQLPELQNPQINFWCLIEDTPDNLAHNATLGAADQQSSLRLWLDPTHEPNSSPLENLIDDYMDRSYSVFIASDHGHVEAKGFGQPSEGLLAQTRGKRARIYQDKLVARHMHNAFPDTILWGDDGILPDRLVALMPAGREAFAPTGEVVVTHGGISIDEVMVPLIQITKANS